MNADEYQRSAVEFLNIEVRGSDVLTNAVLGLNGESGEVADELKKILFHGHMIDVEFFTKEAGDVAWYLALLCTGLGINLSDVMRLNIEKLSKRYPNRKFSSERSINRDE